MKKTKWQAVFIVCQFICMFIVPVLCLWLEYGSNAFISVKYKISITGIIFVLLFFSLSKRFWLNDSLKKLQTKIANIETDALSMTDQQAIATAKKVYKRYRYIDLLFKLLMPLVLLVGLTVIIKALEEQALKMYGVFLWSTISFAVGIGFKVLEIHFTKFAHEESNR